MRTTNALVGTSVIHLSREVGYEMVSLSTPLFWGMVKTGDYLFIEADEQICGRGHRVGVADYQ